MMGLHPNQPSLGAMMVYLQRIANGASSPAISEGEVKAGKGRDMDVLAREIAGRAARDFYGLTGKTPTLSRNRREFPYFLEAVFKALEIRSSARDHAAEALRQPSA